LADAGDHQAGLGNTVGFLDGMSALSETFRLGGGLQVEAPTRTDPALGDAHVVLLPYLQGVAIQGPFSAQARVGWGLQLGGSGHPHGPGVQMNPHTTSDLLWRFNLAWTQEGQKGWIRPGLGVDGVQELVEHRSTVIAGLLSIQVRVGRPVIRAEAQLPMTQSRRFAYRGLVSVTVPLGAVARADQLSTPLQ